MPRTTTIIKIELIVSGVMSAKVSYIIDIHQPISYYSNKRLKKTEGDL